MTYEECRMRLIYHIRKYTYLPLVVARVLSVVFSWQLLSRLDDQNWWSNCSFESGKTRTFPFSVFLEYFLWLAKTLVTLLNQIIPAIHSLLGHTRLVFPRFASVMWIFFTLLLVHRTVIFVVIGCCKCLSAVSLPYCTSSYRIGSLTFKQLTTFSRSLSMFPTFF